MYYLDKEQEIEIYLNSLTGLNKTAAEIILSICDIGNTAGITLDEIGMLFEETKKVLEGKTKREDLSANISKNLLYPNPETTKKMVISLNGVIDGIQGKSSAPNLTPTPKPKSDETYFRPVVVKKTIQDIPLSDRPAKPTQPKQAEQIGPKKMIPDHDYMERTEGIHLHSQTVMPSSISVSKPNQPTQQPEKKSWSVVDQKLNNLVKSTSAPGTPPQNLPTENKNSEDVTRQRMEKYGKADPYREPLN